MMMRSTRLIRVCRVWLAAGAFLGVVLGILPVTAAQGTQAEAQTQPAAQTGRPVASSADRRRIKSEVDPKAPEYKAVVEKIPKLPEMTPEERRVAIDDMFALLGRHKPESVYVTHLVVEAANAAGRAADFELAAEVYERGASLFEYTSLNNPTWLMFRIQCTGNAKRARAFAAPLRLEGVQPDGTSFPAADYKGKVLLVEFWEIGCPGCARELPKLKALHAKYKDRGFDVVGVNVDRNAQAVAEFMKRQEVPWRTIMSSAKGAPFEVASHYAVTITPTIWLVGPDGLLRSTNAFPTPELDKLVDELLKKTERP